MIVKGCFNGVSRVVYGCFEGAQDPFLAAMSSSRSDVVTKCVRSRVRLCVPFFLLLVSLEFYVSCPLVFQWCLKKD